MGRVEKKKNWDDACEMCKMPDILHKGPCSRKTEVSEAEHGALWKERDLSREKMKPIRRWQGDQEVKEKMQIDIILRMEKIAETQNTSMAKMLETLKERDFKTAKIVKPTKVLLWKKYMTL